MKGLIKTLCCPLTGFKTDLVSPEVSIGRKCWNIRAKTAFLVKTLISWLRGPWVCRVYSVPIAWPLGAGRTERFVCETRHWAKFTAKNTAAYWRRRAWGGISTYRFEIERMP